MAIKYDISVIITAHRESLLIHRTLRSVYEAIHAAESEGIACELLIVLDRADEDTRSYIDRFPEQAHRTLSVDVGDLGTARNLGSKDVTGEWIAFIDADDLCCPQWLVEACKYGRQRPGQRLLLHSEHNVFFEADNFLVHYPSSNEPHFDPMALVGCNYWTSILFFRRALLDDRQFAHIVRGSGFGYEDWHFISEQISLGGEVHAVPGTCNFVRRKWRNSMLAAYAQSKSLLPFTDLLDPVQVARRSGQHLPRLMSAIDRGNSHPANSSTAGMNHWQYKLERRLPKLMKVVRKVKREVDRAKRKYLLKRQSQGSTSQANGQAAANPLWDSCQAVHAIEPKIFPSDALFARICDHTLAAPLMAKAYGELSAQCFSRPTHVILVPWLKKGGADLEAINYARAIRELSPENSVIVIATENADCPWADRLPQDVRFIPFGHYCRELSPELQNHLLATFLVQLRPQIIHNMNSAQGFTVFRDHGSALRKSSKLYVSVFCEDITLAGQIVGYAFDQLADCFSYLDGVMADNQRILNVLHDVFGYPIEQLHLHHQPTQITSLKPSVRKGPLEVLWAGRLDRQKRPDILKLIAARLQGSPIHFNVFGSSVLEQESGESAFQGLANVTYRGAFDGFSELPLSEFDVLLHTAQWEGMPNLLLESLAHGIPVVAAGVGGVPELVENHVTGICVTPFDDVEQYCAHLKILSSDRRKLSQLALSGKQRVADQFCWTAFHAALRQMPEYANPSSAVRQQRAA